MEILDIFDENRNKIGSEERSIVHEKGLWHFHVGIWLMNKNGELLLQQRSKEKKVNPLKWSRTGGHVDSGETPLKAIQRETAEEVGVTIPEKDIELLDINDEVVYLENLGVYNRHFVHSYFAYVDYDIEDYVLQKEEVYQVAYMSIEEIEKIYNSKDYNYTFCYWKNFENTLKILKEKRENIIL